MALQSPNNNANPIHWADIEARYRELLVECGQKLPLSHWRHPPCGIEPTTHKTKYGLASRQGVVKINRAFVGTKAWRKLDLTLRHELAHLAVGIDEDHNRNFQWMADLFGVDEFQNLDQEIEQIMRNIGFNYLAIAHLEDGSTFELGGCHRKTRRYTEYDPNGRRPIRVRGKKVLRFSFENYAKPAQSITE